MPTLQTQTLQAQVRSVRIANRFANPSFALEFFPHSSPFFPRQIFRMGRLVCSTSYRWCQQAVSRFSTTYWRLTAPRYSGTAPRRRRAFKTYVRLLSRVSLHGRGRRRLRSATLDWLPEAIDASMLTHQSSLYQSLHRRLQLAHALGDRSLIEALEQELQAIGASLWRVL